MDGARTRGIDEQDRLTCANNASGAIPCGGTQTAGSVPAASYTYGDAAHLHAATAYGGQWTGSYDASGDLTCPRPEQRPPPCAATSMLRSGLGGAAPAGEGSHRRL